MVSAQLKNIVMIEIELILRYLGVNRLKNIVHLKLQGSFSTYHGVRAVDGPGPDFVEGLFGQVGSLVSLLKLGLGLSKLCLVRGQKMV